MLATLYVASSLALVALGGPDLTGGFRLGTLRVVDTSAIMGPALDTVVVSCNVRACHARSWAGA
jgi:hypothetical protein